MIFTLISQLGTTSGLQCLCTSGPLLCGHGRPRLDVGSKPSFFLDCCSMCAHMATDLPKPISMAMWSFKEVPSHFSWASDFPWSRVCRQKEQTPIHLCPLPHVYVLSDLRAIPCASLSCYWKGNFVTDTFEPCFKGIWASDFPYVLGMDKL